MNPPIRCACLLAVENGRILLVRVRDNMLWYLPGGKIEPGEAPADAACREVREELGIELDAADITLTGRVLGPDLAGDGQVELNCFSGSWRGQPTPAAEVSEVAWWPLDRLDCFAPAVRKLVNSL
ncbi:NUDIX domain-containing protein [Salinisphaera sp.]|uniref:NUDIX hydrolase n=1 Tax=Salinisphaera sp. TaxID=1914330 RepID=UPI002D773664|nr:NUDIX domain-containing protein [Salinisphaera sp.]HET7313959.1 NUDIX domain-containing protein [Salinisphaera sp.]